MHREGRLDPVFDVGRNGIVRNADGDVAAAVSLLRQERWEFVPFVNLFSGFRYADSKTGIRSGTGVEFTPLNITAVGAWNEFYPIDTAIQTVRKEGVFALWNGLTPTLIRNASNQATVRPIRTTAVAQATTL